jgi:hypothetical protein
LPAAWLMEKIGRKHFTTEAALADMLAASTLTP